MNSGLAYYHNMDHRSVKSDDFGEIVVRMIESSYRHGTRMEVVGEKIRSGVASFWAPKATLDRWWDD